MPAIPKPTVVKDPEWLKVVRQMPCWVAIREDAVGDGEHLCSDTVASPKNRSECSHLDGRSRDDRVLPMCGLAHRTGRYSWHGGQETFCRYHGVEKPELIREAEDLYAAYLEGK